MRLAGRLPISRVSTDHLRDVVLQADLPVAAEHGVADRLADNRAGAEVRHVARHMFEE
jgi:hypothetical protein